MHLITEESEYASHCTKAQVISIIRTASRFNNVCAEHFLVEQVDFQRPQASFLFINLYSGDYATRGWRSCVLYR